MRRSLQLAALLSSVRVFAAPYIITQYIEVSVYTEESYAYIGLSTTISEVLYTETRKIQPATSALANAISTVTDVSSYDQVTIVDIIVPPGNEATSTSTLNSLGSYKAADYTSYVIPITLTPLPSCSQNWTYVTNVAANLPAIVESFITPATVTPSISVYSDNYYQRIRTTTQQIAILNPTDVPADDLANARSYVEDYALSNCYTPTTYCNTYATATSCTPTFLPTYYSNTNGFNSYDNWPQPSYIPFLLIVILVPIGWLLLWFIIGLWENYMSFKGIMLGQHRKRGMPYSWCCVNLILMCWVGPTYKAKSPEEQVIMKERWDALKATEKLKLWWSWGFRWKYPDMLGEAPEIDKKAFRQRC